MVSKEILLLYLDENDQDIDKLRDIFNLSQFNFHIENLKSNENTLKNENCFEAGLNID